MKKRYIEYDILRILACFCVIMIHSAVFEQNMLYENNNLKYQATNIWGTLSRWAVPAFVMLSGMMILQKIENESLHNLFLKRVLRMVAVYIVWSGVYSFYNVFILGNVYAGSRIKTFIDGCFSGEIHMWYLLVCAGLYLIAPILKVVIENLSSKLTIYWLVAMFVFSSLIPFVVKLDIKFVSVVINSFSKYADLQFLGGWTLYFVLGYYIQQHEFTKKQKNIVYILGIISLAFTMYGTVWMSWKNGKAMGVLPYEYPNIVIFGVSVLVFAKEEIGRINILEKNERMITGISKLTFGIYLSHVLILKILYFVGVNIQMCHPLVSIPVVSLVTFIVGAVLTMCIRKIPIIGCYIA